jgi:hypothetical protein
MGSLNSRHTPYIAIRNILALDHQTNPAGTVLLGLLELYAKNQALICWREDGLRLPVPATPPKSPRPMTHRYYFPHGRHQIFGYAPPGNLT